MARPQMPLLTVRQTPELQGGLHQAPLEDNEDSDGDEMLNEAIMGNEIVVRLLLEH